MKKTFEQRIKCKRCGWNGQLKHANHNRVYDKLYMENSIWIAEGFRWTCPRCGTFLYGVEEVKKHV